MNRRMIYGLLMALGMSTFATMPVMAEPVSMETQRARPVLSFSDYEIDSVIDATSPTVEKLSVNINDPINYTVKFYIDGVCIGDGVNDIEHHVSTIDWLIDDITTNLTGLKTYEIKAVATSEKTGFVFSVKKPLRVVKLRVQDPENKMLKVDETAECTTSSGIKLNLKLTNVSEDLDLSKLEVGYYFTEPEEGEQNLCCDYAGISLAEAPWYISLGKPVVTASDKGKNKPYASLKFEDEVSFKQNAVLELQTRVNKADWSNYKGTDTGNVVIYYDGQLICGEEK